MDDACVSGAAHRSTEGAAWLGAAQVLLLATAFGRVRRQPEGRRLLLAAAVFFVWALGPYLTIAGHNTALLLPQSFFKFVPILSNARIPARALTVVLLMLALCGAMALASIGSHKRRIIALTALAIAMLDSWPRANPHRRPRTAVALCRIAHATSRRGPRGSTGHTGQFWHARIPGPPGAVLSNDSRTPTRGWNGDPPLAAPARAYEDDPVLGALLDLSERKQAKAPTPCRDTLACAVRYVVINERRTSDPLRAFVEQTFDLELLEQNGGRTLYRVTALSRVTALFRINDRVPPAVATKGPRRTRRRKRRSTKECGRLSHSFSSDTVSEDLAGSSQRTRRPTVTIAAARNRRGRHGGHVGKPHERGRGVIRGGVRTRGDRIQ